MSALDLALWAAMLIGWSSAAALTRVQRDDAVNAVDQEDTSPALRAYFEGVSAVNEKARGHSNSETALRVAAYHPDNDTRNAEELGNYYEGDILWPVDESKGRNGLVAKSTRWPNGTVPYRISLGFGTRSTVMIVRALGIYAYNIPCVRFVPRTTQEDYINIINGEGCYSSVGRVGGKQTLSVQSPGCTWKIGTILHELMHALGFLHEQSREDRDNYVDIHLEHVMKGFESNFGKAANGYTTDFGVEYTYKSVMHYSGDAFSKDKNATIVAKPDPNVTLGQRDGFNPNDIKKIRAMYGCPVAST